MNISSHANVFQQLFFSNSLYIYTFGFVKSSQSPQKSKPQVHAHAHAQIPWILTQRDYVLGKLKLSLVLVLIHEKLDFITRNLLLCWIKDDTEHNVSFVVQENWGPYRNMLGVMKIIERREVEVDERKEIGLKMKTRSCCCCLHIVCSVWLILQIVH